MGWAVAAYAALSSLYALSSSDESQPVDMIDSRNVRNALRLVVIVLASIFIWDTSRKHEDGSASEALKQAKQVAEELKRQRGYFGAY